VASAQTPSASLFERTWQCLLITGTDDKLGSVRQMAQDWHEKRLGLLRTRSIQKLQSPGMPETLELVHPSKVQRRRIGTPQGRVALLHAVAHIEFSAINLALDAIYRFQDMPVDYYEDWLRIACEECYHFSLVRHQLRLMDVDYGDLPAHQGLWDVAIYSGDDVVKRMALVPRVLEARGLDVTPTMIERVTKVGDTGFADILHIILRDEIGHVAAGSRWFREVCTLRGLESAVVFNDIIQKYRQDMNAHIKGPFQREARLAAGFSSQELEQLNSLESLL